MTGQATLEADCGFPCGNLSIPALPLPPVALPAAAGLSGEKGTSHFPALSCRKVRCPLFPPGLANGLPVGVQILGRRFREDTVLEAGEVIEERAGVLTPINPR